MTRETAPNQSYIHDLLGQIDAVNREVRQITDGLTDAQMNWRPPDGGWSIGQVLEHLITSGSVYNEHLRPVIARARARHTGAARSAWRPTLMGRFLVRSLNPTSTRKLKAPRIFAPGPVVRPDVVEEFLRCQRELAALVRQSTELDLSRVRTHSPVSHLIRLNLGDCFRIVVVHAQRHLQQMRRITNRY